MFDPAFRVEPRVKRAVSQRSSVSEEPSSNFFVSVHTFGFRERSGGRRQSATPCFDRIEAQIGCERKAERMNKGENAKIFKQ